MDTPTRTDMDRAWLLATSELELHGERQRLAAKSSIYRRRANRTTKLGPRARALLVVLLVGFASLMTGCFSVIEIELTESAAEDPAIWTDIAVAEEIYGPIIVVDRAPVVVDVVDEVRARAKREKNRELPSMVGLARGEGLCDVKIYLARNRLPVVLAHELGHGMGLGHHKSEENLMFWAPGTISIELSEAQRDKVERRVQRRYDLCD